MTSNAVAIVTGGNKGIGFQVARGLCRLLPQASVVLTSRQKSLGEQAVNKLKDEDLSASYMQLDISDQKSIANFAEELKSKHRGVDILVNNAGFAYKSAATNPFKEQAQHSMDVNYFGTRNFSNAIFPLLRSNGRVVNVASSAGGMAYHGCSSELQREFGNPNLTEAQLNDLVERFIRDAGGDAAAMAKWAKSAYGMSKLAVLALSNIQARSVPSGILVNACCPGWCKTDLAGWDTPPQSAEQGADTPIFLATLPPDSQIQGGFYAGREPQKW